jgi:hypothetical protein
VNSHNLGGCNEGKVPKNAHGKVSCALCLEVQLSHLYVFINNTPNETLRINAAISNHLQVLFTASFHLYSIPVIVLNIPSSVRNLAKASCATIGTWDGVGGTRLS